MLVDQPRACAAELRQEPPPRDVKRTLARPGRHGSPLVGDQFQRSCESAAQDGKRDVVSLARYEHDDGHSMLFTQSLIVGGLPFEVRLPLSKRENFKAWMESKEIAADTNRRGVPVEQALAELAR